MLSIYATFISFFFLKRSHFGLYQSRIQLGGKAKHNTGRRKCGAERDVSQLFKKQDANRPIMPLAMW